jgi:hypothetical protein
VPTWERTARFDRDWDQLSADERARFRRVAHVFVADLRSGQLRAGLRVKRVEGTEAVFELTWAPDGRATFEYGAGGAAGPHVIWRRVGRHDILRRP